jgi:hypothetical protein
MTIIKRQKRTFCDLFLNFKKGHDLVPEEWLFMAKLCLKQQLKYKVGR